MTTAAGLAPPPAATPNPDFELALRIGPALAAMKKVQTIKLQNKLNKQSLQFVVKYII